MNSSVAIDEVSHLISYGVVK